MSNSFFGADSPSWGSELRNSFLVIVPSPSTSIWRKRSMIRVPELVSAWRSCVWMSTSESESMSTWKAPFIFMFTFLRHFGHSSFPYLSNHLWLQWGHSRFTSPSFRGDARTWRDSSAPTDDDEAVSFFADADAESPPPALLRRTGVGGSSGPPLATRLDLFFALSSI